ncbi:hypothetical protein [Streptomyces viridosporus]|uniref:hypothetical protein n=1 Tax=Streptomyces viridosporus TaxID=67581 RepID=UPI0036FBDCAF
MLPQPPPQSALARRPRVRGELFVWVAMKRLQDGPWHLRDGGYEPRSKVGTAFLDEDDDGDRD